MIEAAVVAIMNKWYKLEMIEKWLQKKKNINHVLHQPSYHFSKGP